MVGEASGNAPAVGPLVISRRWDRLGTRLTAMVNARCLAAELGVAFRFIWPPGIEDCDLELLFSPNYVESFELDPAAIAARPLTPHGELTRANGDLQSWVASAGPDLILEVDEIFDVLPIPGQTEAGARANFRRSFDEIGWSADVRRLFELCSELRTEHGPAVVYVRAGDIVSGEFRHVVFHEKYSPTPFLEHAISRLADRGSSKVLVLSDNPEYTTYLRERYRSIITSAEVVPGYRDLPSTHRALIDLMLMSRCEVIVSPGRSAFSRLATHLGEGRIRRPDRLIEPGREQTVLRSGIAARTSEAPVASFSGALIARDICWYIDVFGDEVPYGDQVDLARHALEREPDFSGALARLARVATIAGDLPRARGAASQALLIAESVAVQNDPLVEALATYIAVRCFSAVHGRPLPNYPTDTAFLRRIWKLERTPGGRRRRMAIAAGDLGMNVLTWAAARDPMSGARRCRLKLAALDLRRSLRRFADIGAAHLDCATIMVGLRSLVEDVEWLADQSDVVITQVAERLAGTRCEDVLAPGWRQSGLEHHRAVIVFDPVARDLERMAAYLRAVVRTS